MKSLLLSLLALLLLTNCYAQPGTPPVRLNIALVVFPGVEALDLTEPLDVLQIANGLTKGSYHCYTVALTDSLLTTDRGGLHLRPDYTFETMPKPDIVIVPGAGPARIKELAANPAMMAQLQALAPQTQLMMSVCTGAIVLGQAGILDGHRATTHAMTLAALADYPKITVVRGVRYVLDGPVLTTAGITAGIDGALALVEKYSGWGIADAVASIMEYTRPDTTRRVPAAPTPPRPTRQHPAGPVATPVHKRATASAAPSAPLAAPTDPVCHMAVAPTTPHRYTYKSKTYGFCSEACRTVFVANPQQQLLP